LRAKVLTVARFNRMFRNAKENAVLLARVKAVTHDGKLPPGALLKSMDEIKSDLNQYLELKKMDKENEKFPHQVYRRNSLKI